MLIPLLCVAVLAALGAGKDESRKARLSGTFLVCKEYGTLRGTFLTDVRGRDLRRLNFLFGEDVEPRFSPSDDRILFTSARGGTRGLWTMNRLGEQQQRICDGDQGDWFPDGRRIALGRQGQIIARSLAAGEETILSPSGWRSCSAPSCSPNGRKILFVTSDGAKDTLCLLGLGESIPRRLVAGEILGAPRWSPDGARIAYQSGAHLWMIDTDGSNRRQLTTTGGIQRRPAWSPDGTAIACCQGPSRKGPWQMAVIRIDGTRSNAIPPDDARSVLCSDWGLEEPGQKPEPKGTPVAAPARIQLWAIEQPVTAATADWAAFCRQKKAWTAVPAEKALPQGLLGGCAIENQSAVFLLLAGKAEAVLIPRPALRSPIQFTLLDAQGKPAGPVESIRVLTHGADEVVLESSSRSAGAPVKATWSIGGSRTLVQVTPVENAAKLRIEAPLQCVVVPDRFGSDLVADPQALGGQRAFLPWAPLVTALLGSGSDMLVLICPEQNQTAELRKESGATFVGADVAFQHRRLSAGTITAERAWHLERFPTDGRADPLRFKWRMPCPATWRLAVQGEGPRYSAFFSDKESALFDPQGVLYRKSKDLSGAVRLGAIYLYGRTATTPPETLTPVDLLRDALGLAAAERALDEQGLTGYRKAAGPTMWAELSVTLESLRYLFERQLEVQDRVYVGHLCADLLPFVEGMDQRLEEYAAFARELRALGKTSDAIGPAVEKLQELGRRQRGLTSARELLPLCAKIKQLTVKESDENRKQFEQCCEALLAVVGPRAEILKAYRKLARQVNDAAAIAPLAQPELLAPAEKIRALCRNVLRNRFYTEADWRGEDYNVPAFWLGPRPYQ